MDKTINKVKEHLKKHKGKYIGAAAIAAGIQAAKANPKFDRVLYKNVGHTIDTINPFVGIDAADAKLSIKSAKDPWGTITDKDPRPLLRKITT